VLKALQFTVICKVLFTIHIVSKQLYRKCMSIFTWIWGNHFKHLCWAISITFVWFVNCKQL